MEIEFLATTQTYNKFIKDLVDKIPDDAELYADITYGSKPEILSLFCLLRFVEEFRSAVLEYFIYGKVEFNKNTNQKEYPMIFDITSLYYLFKLMGRMGSVDAKTALKTIKRFFYTLGDCVDYPAEEQIKTNIYEVYLHCRNASSPALKQKYS